jgi:hypothetical protein
VASVCVYPILRMKDGWNGLLGHIGAENSFYERLIALAGSFGPGNPREPLEYAEPCFRDDKSRSNKDD